MAPYLLHENLLPLCYDVCLFLFSSDGMEINGHGVIWILHSIIGVCIMKERTKGQQVDSFTRARYLSSMIFKNILHSFCFCAVML